jgi:glutamate-1-semialdehyde-2,1-aminomutase
VDDRRDLEFVRDVAVRLGAEKMHRWEEVLAFLRKNPAVAAKNAGGVRNEGYYKSVASERPAPPLKRRPLKRSAALRARAEKLIPSCSQTFSKAPTQFVQGVTPVFLQRGKGGRVWDVDGNEYIDYPLALGPVILGHDHPDVTEAVRGQLKDGLSFSLPHPLEVELAALLAELIPCAEMVRYGKNGSDATAGAVRAARAFTGREKIACSGYHGWQDWFIGTTTRRAGVPVSTQALTLSFEYNDIAGLKRIFDQNPGEIAAVVMEPIGVVEPKDDFLQQVRELTKARGALLVFDEIVTGFRLDLGGAQKHFGVVPDLACFGKAMANGFPLAAVVGRRDVMKVFDEVFFSFTFGGEAAALAAAVATINVMKREPVIDHLWEMGQRLKDGYNVMARQLGVSAQTSCVGLAPHTVMTFGNADGKGGLILRSLLQQELVKRGVLFLTGHNVCYAHTPADIEQTLRAHRAALDVLARALKSGRPETFLEGEPVQAVFRKP